MTAEEYWNSEGIRFLNPDGTLPSTEERVKEGYQRGWENGWERADQVRNDQERRIRQSETPRTDAVFYSFHNHGGLVALARELEKELYALRRDAHMTARLREELDRFTRGCQGSCYACEPVGEMNLKLEAEVERLREKNEQLTDLFEYYYNCFDEADVERMDLEEEVARLRELLNKAEHSAKLWEMDALRYHKNEMYWNERAEKAESSIATAPEEPVIQDSRITEPEWRELGPDEVICEGDEIQWPEKDWQTAKSSIGYKVGYWDGLVKARTRRPLPKQKWIPNPNYETATHVVDPKLPPQDEIPLDTELKRLEDRDWITDPIPDITTCIRYLRDEVQKLKEGK